MKEARKYKEHVYIVTDEKPQNDDWVLTDNYGVWEFRDETGNASAPMPYWANWKTCKKIVESDDKNLCDKCSGIRFIKYLVVTKSTGM